MCGCFFLYFFMFMFITVEHHKYSKKLKQLDNIKYQINVAHIITWKKLHNVELRIQSINNSRNEWIFCNDWFYIKEHTDSLLHSAVSSQKHL